MNTQTNQVSEAAAATAVGATAIAADWFNLVDRGMHFLLAVAGLVWWIRLWWNNPKQPPPSAPDGGFKPTIKLLALALLFNCSCSSLKVDILETQDGTKTSTIRVRTLFDAKSELAKLRTSATDKTQSVTLSGLSQESNSTNLVEIIDRAVSAAVTAGVKAAKP